MNIRRCVLAMIVLALFLSLSANAMTNAYEKNNANSGPPAQIAAGTGTVNNLDTLNAGTNCTAETASYARINKKNLLGFTSLVMAIATNASDPDHNQAMTLLQTYSAVSNTASTNNPDNTLATTVSFSFAPTLGTTNTTNLTPGAVFRITNIAANVNLTNNVSPDIAWTRTVNNNNLTSVAPNFNGYPTGALALSAATNGAQNGGVANATEIAFAGNTLGSVIHLRVSNTNTALNNTVNGTNVGANVWKALTNNGMANIDVAAGYTLHPTNAWSNPNNSNNAGFQPPGNIVALG